MHLQLSPDIGLPAVALSTDHLRAHPVGGTGHRADACARHADGLQPFAGTKISQLHVARWIPEDVGTWEPGVNIKDVNILFHQLLSTRSETQTSMC